MKILFPRLSRISLEDWLKYHPYDKEMSSDHFYISMSNDIQHEILHIDINDNLVGSDYKYLSCTLACYFEDIVSQTGIWTTFVDTHKSLYNKYLPFYDTEDYAYGEINLADIRFLIWHFCSNLSVMNHLIDPYSLDGEEMALIVYNMLTEASDQAPRNEDLRNALILPSDATVYQAKEIADYLFFGSYLNRYYMMTRMEEAVINIKNQKGVNKKNLDPLIYDKHAELLFNTVSPVLAQHSFEILACRVGESHPQYRKIQSVSKRKEGLFRYKGSTVAHVQLEHIATGLTIEINTTHGPDWKIPLVADQTVVRLGFTEWNDDRWVQGTVFRITDPEKMIPDDVEKYLFAPVASQLGVVKRQEECFLEVNNGKRLAFFKDKKAAFSFVDDIWGSYHGKYGESMDRKLFDVHNLTFNVDDDSENIVVFFNPQGGVEFYADMAHFISCPGNPFFVSDSEANIETLLFDECISTEFVSLLIENRMIEIEPLLGEGGYQYVWNNCDFLLRYWKREYYRTEPKLFVE